MNHWVYILKSKRSDNWSYVGSTSNLGQRLKDHNSGKTRSTKAYKPLFLLYQEQHKTREEAYKQELYLKSSNGRREKTKIIKAFYSEIARLEST